MIKLTVAKNSLWKSCHKNSICKRLLTCNIYSINLQVDWKVTLLANVFLINSQLTFTCSKSTIEALEKSVKYVQSHNKNTKTTSFEQMNASWVCQSATFWQFVSKILVRKVLSWLLWIGFTFYWLCC